MPIAKRRILSKAITVEAAIGRDFKRNGKYQCARITDPKTEMDFLDTVEKAYQALYKLSTGRKLIEEINASGKSCVIFCGSLRGQRLHAGAAIMQDLGDKRASLERLALPLCDYGNMLINDDPGDNFDVDFSPIREKRVGNVRKYYKDVLTKEEKSFRDNNKNFQLMYLSVSQGHHDPESYVSQKCGITKEKLKNYLEGKERVNTSDNFRLSLGLYDHLLRGEGCDTAVRLTAEIGINSSGAGPTWFQKRKGITAFDLDKHAARHDVMLGHELIHAWRMMTGRRLVASGWEEEMMTVGLGPAANFPFTENRLRSEAGHPARTKYAAPAKTFVGKVMAAKYNVD